MAELWSFATSGSLGGLVPVLQPRSGGFKKQNPPRTRMGGGFGTHSPPRSSQERASRPTRQLFHNDRNSEQFVARSMRTKGLVPTLPDGSQPRPLRQPPKKVTIGSREAGPSHKVEKEINKLSSEYIDNLQMQIQILEKEIEITKIRSSNDIALLRSSLDDGEVRRKKLQQRPGTGILSLHTPQAMQTWLRAFFSRHSRDQRIAPHRDAVLASFRENLVTGHDAVTLSAQDLRDELKITSLAVRKLLIAEIESDAAKSQAAATEQERVGGPQIVRARAGGEQEQGDGAENEEFSRGKVALLEAEGGRSREEAEAVAVHDGAAPGP